MENEDLVYAHFPLADKLAWQFNEKTPSWIELDDLKSAAYLGLIEAAHKQVGEGFSVYAKARILGSIKDYLRSLNWGTRSKLVYAVSIEDKYPAKVDPEPLEQILDGLDGVAIKVIIMYYEEGQKMKDIGSELGLSEARISQLLRSSKETLRKRMVS